MNPNLEKPISNIKEDFNSFQNNIERNSISNFGNSFEKISEERQHKTVQAVAENYIKKDPVQNYDPEFLEKQENAERIVLALSPEEDDEVISELLGSVQENGIRNTIHAIEKTESFHIKDDFHKVLVQYIKAGYKSDVRELSPLYPGLNMTLYEVSLQASEDEKDKEKNLEQLLASMEQFYSGMFSVSDLLKGKEKYFSIEIAYPQNREEVVFFCAVPDEKKNIFRNQLLAIFSKASIKEITDDYNIFNKQEYISYCDVVFDESDMLPIKTYKELNYDPLNIILKSFSNLAVQEGAAIQIMLSPDFSETNKKITKAIDKIQKGDSIKDSLNIKGKSIIKEIGGAFSDILFAKNDEKKEIKDGEKRSSLIEKMKQKNSSRFYKVNIRLITSGNSQHQADAVLSELESAFYQFEQSGGNKFIFKKAENKNINIKIQDYTYRVFDKNNSIYLNISELTSLFHFPYVALKAGDNLSVSSFTSSGVSKKMIGQSNKFGLKTKQENEITSSFNIQNKDEKIVDVENLKDKNLKEDVLSEEINNKNKEIRGAKKTSYLENQNSFILEKQQDDWTLKGDSFVFENKQSFIDKDSLDLEDFADADEAETDSFSEKKYTENDLDFSYKQQKVDYKNNEYINNKEEFADHFFEKSTPEITNNNQIKEKKIDKVDESIVDNFIKKDNVVENKGSSFENLGDASFKNEKPILLGFNEHQGVKTDIFMQAVDRMKHMYVIGKSGTGKTSILKNMVLQDIENGDGVCFIDPHGSDIQDILAQIPEHRHQDVVYFDPTNLEKPMGLNMMEYDENHPEQKSFVVDELLGIFKKLYSSTPESMGPAFEQYFRNATMLVLEDPSSGNTMVEISRVLSDENFRNKKLSGCKNMIVKQFWEKIATQAGGESELANIVPYITNKFDVFLSNDFLRPIIAQEKSAFNFRKIMDERKILLVNMSKGKLGDINANLIGLIIVGKILMAALSRVDSLDSNLPPFYLYIDEFQNVTTDSISQILSEARKYKLSLNIAHQFISQIDDGIRDAVFGNVGSMAIFRVGPEDAEFLEKQVSPTFTSNDIMNLKNWNAYIKMLVDGEPQKAFNLATYPPKAGKPEVREYLKQLSVEKYGRPRLEIEKEVMEKFKSLM